jgi:hypothetical protein
MSQALKKYAPYLHMLQKSSPKARNALIKQNCSPEFVKCICECVKNVLIGNVTLSPDHKKRLKHHKHSLRKLVLKKTPLTEKKRIVQSGGFLGALLAPIVKVLSGLFGSS